jgi:hypothetical protein
MLQRTRQTFSGGAGELSQAGELTVAGVTTICRRAGQRRSDGDDHLERRPGRDGDRCERPRPYPNYRDNPVKVVVYVDDPPVVAAAIRAEGLEVTREPTPVPELGDAVVGLARDPDGYVIELLQRPARAES